MTTEEELSSLGAVPAVESVVRDVCANQSVETNRRANYLSIRPSPVGAIAVYAHAQHVSIAVSPDRALRLRTAMPYAEHIEKTPATTYVIVRAPHLPHHHQAVVDLAVEALGWRATGPRMSARSSGGTASPSAEIEICPTCWTEITPAEACLCD